MKEYAIVDTFGSVIQAFTSTETFEDGIALNGGILYTAPSGNVFEHVRRGDAWVERPAAPTSFHVWDSAAQAWVPEVSQAKRVSILNAVTEYRRRKELPLVYDAKTLDTDDETREQLMFKAFEFAERARLNQPAGAASRVWENADNTFFTFDTDQQFRNWLGGFVITLSNRTAQQRIALRQHVQNIRALTTVEDIIAYDITVGWPP